MNPKLPLDQQLDMEGFRDVTTKPDGGLVAIKPLMFTHAIVDEITWWGHEGRWCYHSYDAAHEALEAWKAGGYEDEPQGWHRHPATGRRREDGDPAKETIRW